MNTIFVTLRKGYHHAFDDLVKNPPKNVTYEIPKSVSSSGQFGLGNVLKRKVWRTYANVLDRPNHIYVPVGKNSQLIHSTSGFLVKNEFPWVMDLEHAASFVGFEANRLHRVRNVVRKVLMSEWCKKIMPWTSAAEKSIASGIGNGKILKKSEVVYPAMQHIPVKKIKHDKMNLFFVAYDFYVKGGREMIEAYEILKTKFDIGLTVVTKKDEHLVKKYPDIKFVETMPRRILLEKYFSQADIFVLPSLSDTFGMLYLEAMNAGVPIVASNTFATAEMIKNCGVTVNADKYSWYGKDFLFSSNNWKRFKKVSKERNKPEIVKQLVEKISLLLDNSSLRKKLGRNGKREIVNGKFSIRTRNEKLRKIYEEAIRS